MLHLNVVSPKAHFGKEAWVCTLSILHNKGVVLMWGPSRDDVETGGTRIISKYSMLLAMPDSTCSQEI